MTYYITRIVLSGCELREIVRINWRFVFSLTVRFHADVFFDKHILTRNIITKIVITRVNIILNYKICKIKFNFWLRSKFVARLANCRRIQTSKCTNFRALLMAYKCHTYIHRLTLSLPRAWGLTRPN